MKRTKQCCPLLGARSRALTAPVGHREQRGSAGAAHGQHPRLGEQGQKGPLGPSSLAQPRLHPARMSGLSCSSSSRQRHQPCQTASGNGHCPAGAAHQVPGEPQLPPPILPASGTSPIATRPGTEPASRAPLALCASGPDH